MKMRWGKATFLSFGLANAILIFVVTATHSPEVEVRDNGEGPPLTYLKPDEQLKLVTAKRRVGLAIEFFQSLAELDAAIEARKDSLGIHPRQEESDEEEESSKVNKVDKILATILEEEEKSGKAGKNASDTLGPIPQSLVGLDEEELLDLERKLERILDTRESGNKGSQGNKGGSRTGSNGGGGNKTLGSSSSTVKPVSTTTKRPRGILNTLRRIYQSGYLSRRNISRLLSGTRTAVEYLEDIGLVNELSTPILIGDELLGGLQSLVDFR